MLRLKPETSGGGVPPSGDRVYVVGLRPRCQHNIMETRSTVGDFHQVVPHRALRTLRNSIQPRSWTLGDQSWEDWMCTTCQIGLVRTTEVLAGVTHSYGAALSTRAVCHPTFSNGSQLTQHSSNNGLHKYRRRAKRTTLGKLPDKPNKWRNACTRLGTTGVKNISPGARRSNTTPLTTFAGTHGSHRLRGRLSPGGTLRSSTSTDLRRDWSSLDRCETVEPLSGQGVRSSGTL